METQGIRMGVEVAEKSNWRKVGETFYEEQNIKNKNSLNKENKLGTSWAVL